MQSRLLERTRDLLAASGKRTSIIAKDTAIPYPWLYDFRTRRPESAAMNVAYVETLYVYLTGKPLELAE